MRALWEKGNKMALGLMTVRKWNETPVLPLEQVRLVGQRTIFRRREPDSKATLFAALWYVI